MPNVMDAYFRKSFLDSINTNENKARKNESLRKMDVYQKRQSKYVNEQLIKEYSSQTVQDMRVISSINLCNRIVNEKASLYTKTPDREFSTRSKSLLSDMQQAQLDALYEYGMMDVVFKKSNRMYVLESQCAMQFIPKNGVITSRILLPHHYDCFSKYDDPETAEGYVLSVYDKSLLYNFLPKDADGNYLAGDSDGIDQVSADADDFKAKLNRYIWWTKDYNFITDARGNIIDPLGRPITDPLEILNPIELLPFVDVAGTKEYEYWVRQGNDVVEFSLDFSVLLSDTAETNKRQSYSQAIVYSEEPPKDQLVGNNVIMHMKLDRNSEIQPKFEWANPSPDLNASLELLEMYLRLFLSAEGQDPTMVSGKATATKYNSGVERLLALIEKFEASADDMDLFKWVEQKALKIMVAWSNLMQGANIKGGVDPLIPELQQAMLPDDLVIEVKYQQPQGIQTKKELEDSQVVLIENGLTSRKMALMELYGLTDEQAEQRLLEIAEDEMEADDILPPPPKPPMPNLFNGAGDMPADDTGDVPKALDTVTQ